MSHYNDEEGQGSHLAMAAVHDQDDGSIELSLAFRFGDFAGKGQAWFHPRRLADAIEAMGAFPLPDEHTVSIEGGYWDDETGELKTPHVALAVCAASRGLVRLSVRTAAQTELPAEASASCLLDYEMLARLRRGLSALVSGDQTTFDLAITTGL